MLNCRGALFGLDARLALVVGGVMALALTAQTVSRLQGDRISQAKTQVEAIAEGLKDRYQAASSMTFDTDLATLGTSGYLNPFTTLGSWLGFDPARDPWGNNLTVAIESGGDTRQLRGFSIPLQLGIVVSAGPDGVFQSTVTAPTVASFETWAPAGDDIGIKFNTAADDEKRALQAQAQLRDISQALWAVAQRNLASNSTYCETPANQTTDRCDVIDGTTDAYFDGEERWLNYYPLEVGDTAPSYTTATSGTARTSGNLASMQALVGTDLGLPTAWAQDSWGRVLRYDSNAYDSTTPPYAAVVWYQ